jgi:hypothetical protein
VSLAKRLQLASRRHPRQIACSQMLPKGHKYVKITKPYTAKHKSEWTQPHCWEVMETTLPSAPSLCPVISNFLEGGGGPLRRTWLVSDLQQVPMQSKLSPPAYKHWPQISATPEYKPWCYTESNDFIKVVITQKYDVYCVLCTYHVHNEFRKSYRHHSACYLFF